MQWIARISQSLIVVLCLSAGMVRADLPDAVGFDWTIERGDIKSVKAWLDEGLDPEFQGIQFGTGLMAAAWYGNIPMMSLFIERGANPRRANRNGEQPVQLAAWNGHMEAVKWLLDHGATLNREGNHWGALHYAVFNGHKELAQYLIGRGAEVNARSPNGSTPLMMAAREGREALIKDLLESGADPKSKNDWGDNALTLSMRYDHYRIGKMIASPEEFAIAVRAPKESYGEASRSQPAPSEIEDLLKKIRAAEAEKKPTDELRKQLMTAITAFRQNAQPVKATRTTMPRINQPRSIVVTARRSAPGAERAQIMVGGQAVSTTQTAPGKTGEKAASIRITPVDHRATQSRIAELMRQIRLEEAQGRPADSLRQQLYDAVDSLKNQ